jgi:hypothetical protein
MVDWGPQALRKHQHHARTAAATIGVDVGQAGPEIERPVAQPIEGAVVAIERELASILTDGDLIAHAPIAAAVTAEILILIVIAAAITAEILRCGGQGHPGERYRSQSGDEQFVFQLEKLPEADLLLPSRHKLTGWR